MKKFASLLLLAASFTFAQGNARPAAHTAPAQSPCVSTLQAQMQADNVAAHQLKSTAYKAGFEQGLALGGGTTLFLVGLIFAARKPKHEKSLGNKPLSRAASA